ncbi:hypothetical protein [Pseudoalteromonas arctica]|uniref:Uncharacterized protein n=1 Tax=Pseudoalteromonas arctica TaxID=394751 RepID=A0A7Y0HAU5_9GAMM|nr:hypothetical protein [Pseudoalteromonas arctica]NMM39683.1 hypothetical protein [Pseudoalteromonas arctica]
MTISVDGNELFDNIEQFKKVFLPLHQLGTQASEQVIKSENDKSSHQTFIKKQIDALEHRIKFIEEIFNSKNFKITDDLFEHIDEDGDEGQEVLLLRSNLKVINELLKKVTPLQSLNNTIALDPDVNDALQQDLSALKERCDAAQEQINKLKSQEITFYSRYHQLMEDERIRKKEEQKLLQELAEEKTAKALRRKGIIKRLLLTSIFVLVVAGYLYKNMF